MNALAFDNGSYRTPPARPGLLAGAFPGVWFYTSLGMIILRSSRLAMRGAYDTPAWCASSVETLRALEATGVRVEIRGVENFSALEGPCVLVGNHMSTLETLVLPSIVLPFKELTFVVKESLLNHPAMKHIMRARNLIVVGRENPREDLKAVLEGGEARIAAGICVAVFPQTTRTAVFDPAAFSSIGVKLARRANVPVVPLALKTDAWGNGRRLKDLGRIDPSKTVRFEFGKPLRVGGRGAEEQREIVEFIAGRLKEWGGTVVNA